ncbi:MAG TPA: endopeptidase La [Chloroflexota bacterium]|nr:endopeptidase La [Chloroflexota bacterium]
MSVDIEEEPTSRLPVLPTNDTVLFPRMVSSLVVGDDRVQRAIDDAMSHDRTVVVVAQRDPEKEDVGPSDLYGVGTEAVIGRVLKMPDGTTNVLVQGQRRLHISSIVLDGDVLHAAVSPVAETVEKTLALEALMRAILALFEKCVKLSRELSEDVYVAAMNADDPGWLADVVGSSLQLSVAQHQEILEVIGPAERLEKVNVLLAHELAVLELEEKIENQVQQEVDKSQREYLLREQLRAIQRELGEVDSFTRDVNDLRAKLNDAGLPDAVRAKAEEEMGRLSGMPAAAPEVGIIRTYLDWLVNLPWHQTTEDNVDLDHAQKVLDTNHYGLKKVKERILEFMAVRKLGGRGTRTPILCFVGPPGVGKTSLGKSISEALGRRFTRVSLGGIHDEAEIRGHRRTYVGALPGRIVQTMRTAGMVNPVFMLDEIDKVGADFRGDPTAALLEVLDPEQNSGFSDHYLDVAYDLSRVLFITTANLLDPIPPALRDRLEVIELPGYVEEDKLQIARRFLIPRQLTENGLSDQHVLFTDDAVRDLIRSYTSEAGVRGLEREIGSICRKVARRVASSRRFPKTVGAKLIARYLGPPRFIWGLAEEHDEVGVATGVYWTEVGGDLATVEATLLDGKGQLILTGQLGNVMKESATAALSYIRSRADSLALPLKFHELKDIHVHLPAGAVPKDGPSAGITMATAITSALLRRPVRRDVAMTGEITLRGRVLPIGGLREKALAAHRAGIKTFILPRKNLKDLVDVPDRVRRDLRFIPVDNMDEVLDLALLPIRDGALVVTPVVTPVVKVGA